MPSLHEAQTMFAAALLQPDAAETAFLPLLEEGESAGRQRLAAYRRSVVGNLLNALEATYPVVAKIVGGPFFREAGRQYVLTHPSRNGDLNEYGEDFADFLASYSHAADLPYLPEVARLEWLIQKVYYAPDAPPPALQMLTAVAPEAWDDLIFDIVPAHARLDSPWPIVAIWTVNQPGYTGPMGVDFSLSARALVLRHGGLAFAEPLSPGEAALFDALVAGSTLGSALAQATVQDPDLDVAAIFQRFTSAGLLLGAHRRTNYECN